MLSAAVFESEQEREWDSLRWTEGGKGDSVAFSRGTRGRQLAGGLGSECFDHAGPRPSTAGSVIDFRGMII